MARSLDFPRKLRLLTAAQFRAVYQGRDRAFAGPLQGRMRANGLNHARLGMAISVRVAGGAVARNRLRRQVRESFRQHQHRLAGLDVVVSLPRRGAGRVGNLWRVLPRLWAAVAGKAEAVGAWNG